MPTESVTAASRFAAGNSSLILRPEGHPVAEADLPLEPSLSGPPQARSTSFP